jgi:predicted O-methyltransferase YrrM
MEPYRSWVPWMSGLGDGGRLLYSVVRMTRPQTIVEIGSARGFSTCALALACAENGSGTVFAIDPHLTNDWTDVGTQGKTFDFLKARLAEYQLESQCSPIRETSAVAGAAWSRPIDLLFIDGDHTKAGVTGDFESFAPWVREDGLIIVHDTGWEREGPLERHAGESWYRADMAVPAYMASLQEQGYQGATLMPEPGLTILHSRPNGFDFLRRRPALDDDGDRKSGSIRP